MAAAQGVNHDEESGALTETFREECNSQYRSRPTQLSL